MVEFTTTISVGHASLFPLINVNYNKSQDPSKSVYEISIPYQDFIYHVQMQRVRQTRSPICNGPMAAYGQKKGKPLINFVVLAGSFLHLENIGSLREPKENTAISGICINYIYIYIWCVRERK